MRDLRPLLGTLWARAEKIIGTGATLLDSLDIGALDKLCDRHVGCAWKVR
jgi:hypothetical protein